MIGLLILAQEAMGRGLIEATAHILGERPPGLEVLGVDDASIPPEEIERRLQAKLRELDEGDGVLILADIFGASHTNAACRLVREGRIELVSGVSLPMLIRVLNHRGLPLGELAEKAASAGSDGIVCASRRT